MAEGVSFRGERYVVFDGLMSSAELDDLRLGSDGPDMERVVNSVDPDAEVQPLSGNRRRMPPRSGGLTSCDLLVRKVVEASALLNIDSRQIGEVTLSDWVYPKGSRLGWHDDGAGRRLAAFVFYTHPVWEAGWGGDLEMLDVASRALDRPLDAAVLAWNAPTINIKARPNRLVVFLSGTPHAIRRVEDLAISYKRCSTTGFLLARSS